MSRELKTIPETIKALRGLMLICAGCEKIRDGADHWHIMENYISKHSDVRFSRSHCLYCYARMMQEIRRSRI